VTSALDRQDGRSMRSGFLRSAAATPDAPALVVGPRTWTYAELEATARSWAGAVVERLERAPRRVGFLGYRSELSYAGTLAALLAGAAFVPLNPRFPAQRTRAMVRAADLDAILVEDAHAEALSEALEGLEDPPLVVAPQGEPAPALEALPPVLPGDVAYLLFTSGSTGVPKGVPVTHANVAHFVDAMSDRYDIRPDDRLSQTFDQTFDLSVFDLFMAWEHGACVYSLRPIDLVAPSAFVRRHELTIWFSVPSIPALMRKKGLLEPDSLPTLRWSLFCGEALPRETAQAWQAAAPSSTVENLYGPTELTLACLAYRWDPVRSPAECVGDFVPIGRPYPGLGALVVDEARRPLPPGEAGELLVCGPQTVPGYWRDPQRTAERFLDLEVEPGEPAVRFYATGDRVVRREGGDYVYLGRTDEQVQVRGFRVELGEIETALREAPGVVQGIACGWPMRDGVAEGVVAFVSGAGVEPAAVTEEVRRRLPEYMVPDEVVAVDEMPLNPNGKVDRKALQRRLEERL
jgi:amino acid adenylation domain-containing protein